MTTIAVEALEPADTYRGWSIRQGRWPEPEWSAISPNYDVSWEGFEDGFVDNGEKADAPTYDTLIAIAAGLATDLHPTKPWRCRWHEAEGLFCEPPKFTASIDAAMTLVPEGWRVCQFYEDPRGPWFVHIGKRDTIRSSPRDPSSCDGYAAIPAVALCIAALKARHP